jgi:pimeloyl-ACP methyl ester carboxylesterase
MTTTTAAPAPNKSTIVRARLTAQLMLFRAGFRMLERVAPNPGGRLATRLWATPPRSGSSRPDNRPYPGTINRLLMPSGPTVVVESWGRPTDPPVYLLHGWGGWRGQLGAFVGPLLAAGYRVVAVDAPSHGDAGPSQLGRKRAMFPEFVEALWVASKEHGQPAPVIAHSMGASAAALAVRDGFDATRLVLVAPFADLSGGISEFCAMLGIGTRVRAQLVERLERLGGRPFEDYDIAHLPAHTEVPPTLVLHDRTDRTVEAWQGAAVAGAWPGARLVRTNGLGHQRILRDPDVVAQAVAFLT